jgi:hypothetical protein
VYVYRSGCSLKSKLQLTGTCSANALPPIFACVIAQQYSSPTFSLIVPEALLRDAVIPFFLNVVLIG